MLKRIVLVATLLASSATYADFEGGNYIYNSIGDNGGYSFSWNVQDAYNDFGHREDRGLGKSGIDETRGSYHVQLPDGRVQTVTYFVDPYNGYQAKVLYEGEPIQYAAQPYTPAPAYASPPASPKAAIVYPVAAPVVTSQPAYTPVKPVIAQPAAYAPVKPVYTPAPAVVQPVYQPAPAINQPVYSPVDYAPAPVSYPHNPVWNLIVPDSEHHKIKHLQEPDHVSPLAPPPAKTNGNHIHDPYLKTEAELKYKDFSGPFFYANTKKITNKDKKLKTHDHNRLYY